MHVIDGMFLSVPSSNIHGPQATFRILLSGHSDLNSHFKLAHKVVTMKVSRSTNEISLKLESVYEKKIFIFFYESKYKKNL